MRKTLKRRAGAAPKKFQEGGRVRAGGAGMTSAARSASRRRTAELERRMEREEELAREQALAERATGGRYQDPPRPRRATGGDPVSYSDAEAGNPRAPNLLEHMLGPTRSGAVRGEDVRPGGDNSIGIARSRAYGRADAAAMQADIDREVRRRMSGEAAYRKGGKVSAKGKKK